MTTAYDEAGIRKTAAPYKAPQLHYNETARPVFVGEESIKVHLLAEPRQAKLEEKDWLYRAYQIAMATWTTKELHPVKRSEMIRVLKHEMTKGAATVPLEAFQMTFTIEGIPRSVTHQIVRHRSMGFGQESFRVSDIRTHQFRIPESIRKHEKIWVRGLYETTVKDAYDTYAKLIDEGIPHEDARLVMGTGTITYLVMTGNLRAFVDYIKARTQDAALDEHRRLAQLMFREFVKTYPNIYDIIKSKFPSNDYTKEALKSNFV